MTIFTQVMTELSADIEERNFRDSVDRLSAPTGEFAITFKSTLIEGDVRFSSVVHSSQLPSVDCSFGRVILGKGIVPAAVCIQAIEDCELEIWAIDYNNTEHLVARKLITAGHGYRIDVSKRR